MLRVKKSYSEKIKALGIALYLVFFSISFSLIHSHDAEGIEKNPTKHELSEQCDLCEVFFHEQGTYLSQVPEVLIPFEDFQGILVLSLIEESKQLQDRLRGPPSCS